MIEFYKMSYFDTLKNGSEREKMAESSDGVITVSIITFVLTFFSLIGCLFVDVKRERQEEKPLMEPRPKEEEKEKAPEGKAQA